MILKLYRDDLREEHASIACSATQYQHFKPNVQQAISCVGKATFFDREGAKDENYNVIYPPSNQAQRLPSEVFVIVTKRRDGATPTAEKIVDDRFFHNDSEATSYQQEIEPKTSQSFFEVRSALIEIGEKLDG